MLKAIKTSASDRHLLKAILKSQSLNNSDEVNVSNDMAGSRFLFEVRA